MEKHGRNLRSPSGRILTQTQKPVWLILYRYPQSIGTHNGTLVSGLDLRSPGGSFRPAGIKNRPALGSTRLELEVRLRPEIVAARLANRAVGE